MTIGPLADRLLAMQIPGSLPLHVARAYGAPSPAAQSSLKFTPPAASPLVASRVSAPLDLDRASIPASTGAFSLYTRAADKIEVATALVAGRNIDLTA